MRSQLPQVARAGYRQCGCVGYLVGSVVGFVIGLVAGLGEQGLDFAIVETGEIEIEASRLQIRQFQGQQFIVPAGTLGELVLGQDEGALLPLGQVGQFDHRQIRHVELARREDATVPGDDAALAVDQDRVVEAELPDAGRDLGDLFLAVRARIAGIGDQRLDRAIVDLQGGHRGPETKNPP